MGRSKSSSPQEVKKILEKKKMLFAHWDCENKQDASYQQWGLSLQILFKENLLYFSPKKNYFNYGKEEMNRRFLEVVAQEQPDYVFLLVLYDEFSLETLEMIKKVSPKTIILNFSGDDDWRFEDFARYYALFFDYNISAHRQMPPFYKKEGIEDVSFSCGVNPAHYKPLNLPYAYDVSAIGRGSDQRANIIRSLLQQGIDVHIFGHSWEKYPEFAQVYHGPLEAEDFVKVINQTKINLCFTKGGYGKPQFKGRLLEIAACRAFALTEHFSGYFNFFDKKEIIMFKTEEEMLNQVQYYLSHELERKHLAASAYKRVITDYNHEIELLALFKKILSDQRKDKKNELHLPPLHKKIIHLSRDDLADKELLQEKIQLADYITFDERDALFYPRKDYLQAYALEKSGKQISCCDYYVHDKRLGNCMLFKARHAYERLHERDFHQLLHISQLMVTKPYLLKNLEALRSAVNREGSCITGKNTVFLSIPLVEVSQVRGFDYLRMKEAFLYKFLDTLYSLKYQKKLFSSYPLKLLIASQKMKFILPSLKDALFDQHKRSKLKKGF